jgi:predicted aspartyl protease
MGTFHISCLVENPAKRGPTADVAEVLVDTGSELSCVPGGVLEGLGIPREKSVAFVMANGDEIERSVGFAIVRAEGRFTIDEVVVAETEDLLLLGARTLEGLNLRVDATHKKLVAAGPLSAAVGINHSPALRRNQPTEREV